MSILHEKKSVKVSELSKKFKVTEETIRKDLAALAKEEKLTRAYGGAFIQSGVQNTVDVNIRETAYVDSKKKIARSCKNIVENGDTIFLDASTTALFIAKAIADLRLTIVTNSLLIAHFLSEIENINLIVIGGKLNRNYMAFTGQYTNNIVNQMFFDKSFISSRSVNIGQGATDSSETLSEIRKNIVKQSNECYLVVDKTKIGNVSFLKICDLSDLSGIITDKELDKNWIKEINNKKIQYIHSV